MKNPLNLNTDKEIILALKNGDQKAYKQLYMEYYKMVFSFILKNNGTPEDAEDIFQEALIALVNNIRKPGFKLTSKLGTYLYSIIRQMWLYKLRSKKSGLQIIDTEKEFTNVLENGVIEKRIKEKKYLLIEKTLQKIGKDCRKLITDYYYKNHKLKAIGKAMNYSDSFVRVKKNRCMNNFIKMIKENPEYKSIES